MTTYAPDGSPVEAFAVPCFQRQTRFLKTLGVQPVLGGIVLQIEFGQRGVWSVTPTWRLYREPLADDHPGLKESA